MKVIILYRVIQGWRAPIFESINEEINTEVWYGPDFEGTKVVSSRKDYSFKKLQLISFKIFLKSKNGIIAMPLSPFLFFRLIFTNPNVIICEGASNLINSFIVFIYCKLFRKKYIWWSLGKLQKRKYDRKRKYVDWLVTLIEKNADKIITYSSIGEDYYKSLDIDPAKIVKAVNVVDTDRIMKIKNQEMVQKEIIQTQIAYRQRYDFIVLFVGALIKEKSLDLLLDAQKSIEQYYERIGLLIVGDGDYRRSLENKSNILGLKNVEFLGRVIKDNYKYFGTADIFVLPGLGGLAISEAMCYGLPIIASIGDGCEFDLVTKENGIRDINMTSDKLFKYISFFIDNPEIKESFGTQSLAIIKDNFNTSNYKDKILYAITD